MQTIDTIHRFDAVDESEPSEFYNFEHFRRNILLREAQRILETRGIRPGERAPDFELSRAGGGSLRLNDLRGRPVLLHFGSFS